MAFFIPAIMAASAIAGAIGKNRSEAKGAQADATMRRDQQVLDSMTNENRALLDAAGLDLQRREYADAAPSQRMKDITRASILQNLQDAALQRPAGVTSRGFSGGLRPSAIGAGAREAAKFAEKDAMRRLVQGDQFAPINLRTGFRPSALPRSGFLDKLLAGVSLAGAGMQGYQALGGTMPGANGAPVGQTFSVPSAQNLFGSGSVASQFALNPQTPKNPYTNLFNTNG